MDEVQRLLRESELVIEGARAVDAPYSPRGRVRQDLDASCLPAARRRRRDHEPLPVSC